jgi:hypothetical protein
MLSVHSIKGTDQELIMLGVGTRVPCEDERSYGLLLQKASDIESYKT